jgi:hypothetical protein
MHPAFSAIWPETSTEEEGTPRSFSRRWTSLFVSRRKKQAPIAGASRAIPRDKKTVYIYCWTNADIRSAI